MTLWQDNKVGAKLWKLFNDLNNLQFTRYKNIDVRQFVDASLHGVWDVEVVDWAVFLLHVFSWTEFLCNCFLSEESSPKATISMSSMAVRSACFVGMEFALAAMSNVEDAILEQTLLSDLFLYLYIVYISIFNSSYSSFAKFHVLYIALLDNKNLWRKEQRH